METIRAASIKLHILHISYTVVKSLKDISAHAPLLMNCCKHGQVLFETIQCKIEITMLRGSFVSAGVKTDDPHSALGDQWSRLEKAERCTQICATILHSCCLLCYPLLQSSHRNYSYFYQYNQVQGCREKLIGSIANQK